MIRPFKVKSMPYILGAMIFLAGCKASNTQKGAGIGAGVGAVAGGLIGKNSDKTAAGAIIGASVGGAAGALIGRHMDKQAEELSEDLEGATVERVGEGIRITFESGLLFALDSDKLSTDSKENLNELATTLKKYEDTDILVDGHTDATGSDEYNQGLSERRATAVQNYLIDQRVAPGRITSRGFGERKPVARNETPEGRQQNRRVEVAIMANERMKKAAEKGRI